MMRTGRILVVQSDEDLRHRIDALLEGAGHEVSSAPDAPSAIRLLEDGLEPDIVVVESAPVQGFPLAELAPAAMHLALDPELEESAEFLSADGDPRCSPHPAEVARRVEELLLGRRAIPQENEGERTLEVASRLASSLQSARTTEERIEVLIEVFDSYFGVLGSLLMRRTKSQENWMQASRGIPDALADMIFREVVRRTGIRAVRPFLTRLYDRGIEYEVVCVPVSLGDQEITLAVHLEWAPTKASLRQSFTNLLGAAVRSGHAQERLDESMSLLEAHSSSFESLLLLSRDFTRTARRVPLCEKILASLRRELPMNRSAISLTREGEGGMLEMCAASGFSPVRLERIGLSRFHGVGAACLRAESAINLARLPREGAAAREIGMLLDVGLHWAASILDEGEPLGLLFFGGAENEGEIPKWQLQILRAVLGSAAVALRNIRQLERLEGLSGGAIRALVEAYEITNPQERGHSDRVAGFAHVLGTLVGLPGQDLQSLTIAALLHDIGKIGFAPQTQDGSPDHRARIHPIRGSQILSRSKPVTEVIQAVEQHHERYDGRGQPYGLRGEGIHLFGRIVAVANAYDHALRSSSESLSAKDALRRLQRGAGLLYDPGLVAMFSTELERNPGALTEGRPPDWFLESASA